MKHGVCKQKLFTIVPNCKSYYVPKRTCINKNMNKIFFFQENIGINSQLKQELQEVLKFPIEIFRNLEASLKSELLYF